MNTPALLTKAAALPAPAQEVTHPARRMTGADPAPLAAALEPISLDESRDLIRLEGIVEMGLQTFVQVGEALAEIRDRRLYRTEHHTFDAYLDKKWKISRAHACRLIQSAETAKLLPTGNGPKSERQARPLAALPAAQRAEAWQKAVATSPDGQPTAKAVQVVVETMNPQPPKTVRVVADKPKPQTPKTVKVVVRKHADDDPDATKTPLQWLTHWWMLASEEQRRMFDNFRAGLRGGQ